MFEAAEIRRHANGSIDLAYHAQVGRALHGKAVREILGQAGALPGRMMKRVLALLRHGPTCDQAEPAVVAAEPVDPAAPRPVSRRVRAQPDWPSRTPPARSGRARAATGGGRAAAAGG